MKASALEPRGMKRLLPQAPMAVDSDAVLSFGHALGTPEASSKARKRSQNMASSLAEATGVGVSMKAEQKSLLAESPKKFQRRGQMAEPTVRWLAPREVCHTSEVFLQHEGGATENVRRVYVGALVDAERRVRTFDNETKAKKSFVFEVVLDDGTAWRRALRNMSLTPRRPRLRYGWRSASSK